VDRIDRALANGVEEIDPVEAGASGQDFGDHHAFLR
jgi:hypothetical protein